MRALCFSRSISSSAIFGDRGGRGVARGGLAAVVPGAQHRAEHHVHLAAGQFVHLLGVQQELNELFVEFQRLAPRPAVERAEVVHAAVLVVDVEEPVVFRQDMRNFGRTLVKAFCRISCIVVYIGDGVEIAVIDLALGLDLLRKGRFGHTFLRRRGGAGAHDEQRQQRKGGADPLNQNCSVHLLCFFAHSQAAYSAARTVTAMMSSTLMEQEALRVSSAKTM